MSAAAAAVAAADAAALAALPFPPHPPLVGSEAGSFAEGTPLTASRIQLNGLSHEEAARPKTSSESLATLLAAAPDLLALLEKLIDIEGPQPGTGEWANEVQAAIKKARGEK